MDDGLILPAVLAATLADHANAEVPNEACALLGGSAGTRRVSSANVARNRLASPYRYDVDPSDLVRILHDIEARGEALVAIYHSHPSTPAVPSASDLREARYPVIHLVAGRDGERTEIRAWRITDGRAVEVPLIVE